MTTSPPSERSPFGASVSEKMARHIAEHKSEAHHFISVRGCPACLFRDATWPGLVEEKVAP
jgi:hypothetical protein